MVKTQITCDICGKVIEQTKHSKFIYAQDMPKQKDLCIDCATRIWDAIEKRIDEIERENDYEYR